MTSAIILADRGVVEVAGADATKFLHGLLTNDVKSLRPGEARYAALLSPQGKILVDFLAFARAAEEGLAFLLDAPSALVPDLVRRLTLYKLRADISISDRSAEFVSLAFPDATDKPEAEAVALAPDPRSPSLGWRGIVRREGATSAEAAQEFYDARRIAAGVPSGGVDFVYGDAFPHEANMDRLAGVDFKKGCFVGQEVVSRMKHRGTVRKRVTLFHADGPAPAPGTPIVAGDVEIGVTGSRFGEDGLALIRLDKLEDAKAGGVRPLAGGVALEFTVAEG